MKKTDLLPYIIAYVSGIVLFLVAITTRIRYLSDVYGALALINLTLAPFVEKKIILRFFLYAQVVSMILGITLIAYSMMTSNLLYGILGFMTYFIAFILYLLMKRIKIVYA